MNILATMNNEDKDDNQKYNLIWKNIIIKKDLSLKHVNDCINIFNNDDKKLYMYKKLCNDCNECIEIGDYASDDKNIATGLNFILSVLRIHGL
jgi:hypothetical protein